MTTTEPTAAPGTPEDVELLARELMGWRRISSPTLDIWWDEEAKHTRCGPRTVAKCALAGPDKPWAWNPFTDANADVMVLERVREVWFTPDASDTALCHAFQCELHEALQARFHSYADGEHPRRTGWVPWWLQMEVGDYARAALAVLRTTAITQPGGPLS